MNKALRPAIIAGNWKMNKTATETTAFTEALKPLLPQAPDVTVVLCAPFTALYPLAQGLAGTDVAVGAENMHFAASGAYTGEISADMLLDLGVRYVILGHSERRAMFGEDDVLVNRKVRTALDKGLRPIVCVGETDEQREAGITDCFIAQEVIRALGGVSAAELPTVTFAYEPIWAIGTGKTATADEADRVCGAIRATIAGLYGDQAAQQVSILYGGSMKPSNAAELLSKENVDGGLIGGASLKPEEFVALIEAAK
jgi:triosephosphate isomerase